MIRRLENDNLMREWRNGHVWCLKHNTWWKECNCPGNVRMIAEITKDVIEATTPKQGAFLDYLMEDK